MPQVQNGVALYATWGTLWTLLNLTMFLQYNSDASHCDCSMLSLMLLLMALLAWWGQPHTRTHTSKKKKIKKSQFFFPTSQVLLRELLAGQACALHRGHPPRGHHVVGGHSDLLRLSRQPGLHLCGWVSDTLTPLSAQSVFYWYIHCLCFLHFSPSPQLRSWVCPPWCWWHVSPWSRGSTTNDRSTAPAGPACRRWR